MERFFGCKVRIEEFRPRMGEGGELELAERLCRYRSRFDMREEAAPLRREDARDLEGALDELDSMIGLAPVKAQIRDIASIVQNRGADALPCMHMVFTGNPGLRDRVGFYVDFPDYSEAELCEIFGKMVRERGFDLSPAAMEVGSGWIRDVFANRDASFGNARLVRRLVDRVLFKQNARTGDALVNVCDVQSAIADADLAEMAQSKDDARTWFGNPVGFCVG